MSNKYNLDKELAKDLLENVGAMGDNPPTDEELIRWGEQMLDKCGFGKTPKEVDGETLEWAMGVLREKGEL